MLHSRWGSLAAATPLPGKPRGQRILQGMRARHRHGGDTDSGGPLVTVNRKEHSWTELVCNARAATLDNPNHPFWTRGVFDQAALLNSGSSRTRAMSRHGAASFPHGTGRKRREQDGEWRNVRREGGVIQAPCGNAPRAYPEHSRSEFRAVCVALSVTLPPYRIHTDHRARTSGKGVPSSKLPNSGLVENPVVASAGSGRFAGWSSRNPLGTHTP